MNSVAKINILHYVIIMKIVTMNVFILEKPSPSFSFFRASAPIPSSNRKGISPHESGEQGRHMKRRLMGSGRLMNIPRIQLCASVKYKLEHRVSLPLVAVSNAETRNVKNLLYQSVKHVLHTYNHISFSQQLFLQHLPRDYCQTQIQIHGPVGSW